MKMANGKNARVYKINAKFVKAVEALNGEFALGIFIYSSYFNSQSLCAESFCE